MLDITHTAHRRETGLAAGLVRAVRTGDRRRVDIIAEHVTLCLALLDHHLALEGVLTVELLLMPILYVWLSRILRTDRQSVPLPAA